MKTLLITPIKGIMNYCLFAAIIIALLIVSGCKAETIFQSNFENTPANQLPSTTQEVGTIAIDGPSGSVLVVLSPIEVSGHWVQISRQSNQQSVSGLKCIFSKFIGDGNYTFTANLFIPSGSGVATIQFEPNGQSSSTLVNFLHIDFLENNKVRIDDVESSEFGTFPRDKIFIVMVSLKIDSSEQTAHITLTGDGAQGDKEVAINPSLATLSHQLGAVRLWMGFPHSGKFKATNILVTHTTN